jgi:hypothetical protein
MIGQRFDHGVELAVVRALERGGHVAVEGDPLAREQIGVDGLARERVAERENARPTPPRRAVPR